MTPQEVKQISIRLLPDGFTFLDQFHPILPGADYLSRLQEELIEVLTSLPEDKVLTGICSVENLRFCLAPTNLDSNTALLMYQMSVPIAEEEEVVFHLQDQRHNILFSFGLNAQLYHFLERNWPEVSFSHPLFELMVEWNNRPESQTDCMVAQVGPNFLNLLVYKAGKLHLANRFETEGTDNILYHLMNCWTQCGLDVIDNKLYLLTEVEEIRQNIGQYIKQCE